MRNDRIALTHADDPGLFVRITDSDRGTWEFVAELRDEFTFATEMHAVAALAKLFRTRVPRHIVPPKEEATC